MVALEKYARLALQGPSHPILVKTDFPERRRTTSPFRAISSSSDANGRGFHVGAAGEIVDICRLGAFDGVEEDILRRPLLHHGEAVEGRLVIASMAAGVRVDDASSTEGRLV